MFGAIRSAKQHSSGLAASVILYPSPPHYLPNRISADQGEARLVLYPVEQCEEVLGVELVYCVQVKISVCVSCECVYEVHRRVPEVKVEKDSDTHAANSVANRSLSHTEYYGIDRRVRRNHIIGREAYTVPAHGHAAYENSRKRRER